MSMININIAIACAITAAALAAPLAVQHHTIIQLRQDNDGLKQQAALVAPLQDQLAAASQEAAKAAGAPQSEAQVRELARLRNEVSQLRQQSNELAQARQQIQTLNQRAAAVEETRVRSAAEAARSAAAGETEARKIAAMNACISNLRMIDGAKAQWALENTSKIQTRQPWMISGPTLAGAQTLNFQSVPMAASIFWVPLARNRLAASRGMPCHERSVT